MTNEIGPERNVTYRAVVFLTALAAAFGFGLQSGHRSGGHRCLVVIGLPSLAA